MKPGFEEGETCNRDGCTGTIELSPLENCSCHLNAPCHACTSRYLMCRGCDWDERSDPLCVNEVQAIHFSMDTDLIIPERARRVLDPTKIDYRIEAHTSASQKCIGVCPLTTTREEVVAKVKGTFGGRFDNWRERKEFIEFTYIAYTD